MADNDLEKENELDEEISSYFEKIDAYQAAWTELSKCFSSGFMSLAQANYKSTTGRRYGSECYDERMQPIRGVNIAEREEGFAFEIKDFPLKEESEAVGKQKEEVKVEVRRRKAASPEAKVEPDTPAKDGEDEKKEEEEEEVRPWVDPREPLKWFGILVPNDLRECQLSFTKGLSKCLEILTIMNEIHHSAAKIETLNGHVKDGKVDEELLTKLEKVDLKEKQAGNEESTSSDENKDNV